MCVDIPLRGMVSCGADLFVDPGICINIRAVPVAAFDRSYVVQSLPPHRRVDAYADMCADICVDMCVDFGVDMCVDTCVDMCVDMYGIGAATDGRQRSRDSQGRHVSGHV